MRWRERTCRSLSPTCYDSEARNGSSAKGAFSRTRSIFTRAQDRTRSRSLHIVEQMAQLVAFGFQVVTILLVRRDLDGDTFDDPETVAVQADDFFRIVGQKADLPDAEIEEDLGPD